MLSNFRKKFLLNVGVSFGIILMLALAIVLIGIDAKKSADDIFAMNTAISSRSKIAADLSRLREQEKTAEPILNNLLSKIPDEDSILSFSVYVKSLAEKHRAVSSFRFSEEIRGDDYNSIKFNASAQGDYDSIISFMNEFEDAPYLINIASFSVIRQAEKYTAVIDGNIMFRN